ncbi:MAG: hypothetical protein L0196_08835, partial [candidate division Zixibacteria bacterium]|nr:hypothetical protein [candidate division Zixibacteria bacterium]
AQRAGDEVSHAVLCRLVVKNQENACPKLGGAVHVKSGRVIAIQNGAVFKADSSIQSPYAIALTIGQIIPMLDSLQIPFDLR